MESIVVIIILAVCLIPAILSSIKHFKGEGGCCGGGSKTVREHKELDAPKIGEMIFKIEGMHCENCQNSIERAINKLDGVVCKVNLRKKTATLSYSREIDEAEMKAIIESLGFEVKEL